MAVDASEIARPPELPDRSVLPDPCRAGWKPYALSFALIATLIVSTAMFAAWQDRQHYRDRAVIATQNIARLLDDTISSEFDKVDVVLQSVVEHYSAQVDSGSLDAAKLTSYLTKCEAIISEIVNLRITDKNGLVRYGRAVPTIDPFNVADRDIFLRLRDNPNAGLLIEGPVQTRVNKRWVISLARRINARDGSFAGIAYVNVSVAHFNDVLSSVALGPAGAATLRSTDLALVARFPTTRNAVGSKDVSPSLREIMAAHSEAGQYIATTVLDGIERSNAYRKLKRSPFYVLVGLGTEDYLVGWTSNLAMFSALAALAVLATGLATALIFRHARRMAAEVERRSAIEERLRDVLQEQKCLLREQEAILDSRIVGFTKIKARRFLWCSTAFAAMLGYTQNELAGQSTRVVFSSEQAYRSFAKAAYPVVLRGEIFRTEVEHQRRDESIGWYELCGVLQSPESDESIWSCVDISDRKTSEAALAASDTQLRSAFARLETLNAEQADHLRALASDLAQAEQRERDHLYARLHDEVQPLLVATRLSLSSINASTPAERSLQITTGACEHISQALRVARTLSTTLSPPLIREQGLIPALEALRRWVETNHGFKVELNAVPQAEPESLAIRLSCFNFVRELLLNIAKHAEATQAIIELDVSDDGTLNINVADDGSGFDPADVTGGTGLAVLEQRLSMLGGALEITSRPGQTVVSASLPLRQFASPHEPNEGQMPDSAKERGQDA